MTDPVAAKLLDELICLFVKDECRLSLNATRAAIDYIKRARDEHGIPITLSLAHTLRRLENPDPRPFQG